MPRSARPPIPLLGLLALLSIPCDVAAQAAPLVIEVRVGGAVPASPFASGTRVGEGAGAGVSFGVDLAFSGSGRRTLYLGFGQHRFPCQDAGCRSGGRYVATGFQGGYRINLVTRGSVIPWLRGGVVTTRVESPGVPGSSDGVSRLGVGGEVGAGVYIGTSRAIAFNPGVRWVGVNSELPGGSLLRLRYVVADLAVALAF